MSPEEALAESRERLAAWSGPDGAQYRQLANRHRRGELLAEVKARLAAQGLAPDGSDLKTGRKPTARRKS